jgi:hypothetical protein
MNMDRSGSSCIRLAPPDDAASSRLAWGEDVGDDADDEGGDDALLPVGVLWAGEGARTVASGDPMVVNLDSSGDAGRRGTGGEEEEPLAAPLVGTGEPWGKMGRTLCPAMPLPPLGRPVNPTAKGW